MNKNYADHSSDCTCQLCFDYRSELIDILTTRSDDWEKKCRAEYLEATDWAGKCQEFEIERDQLRAEVDRYKEIGALTHLVEFGRLQDENEKLREVLTGCEFYMTEKGVSHEYPVMINARKALKGAEPKKLGIGDCHYPDKDGPCKSTLGCNACQMEEDDGS